MDIKKYVEGDEKKILELFEIAFAKKLSDEFWLWRFKNNPFLNQEIINLMWEGDVLAGHYAVSALEIMVDNRIILSSLSGTTMTHPSFQGKGIFSTLSLELFDRIEREYGVNMVLGFPNKNSHYGLIKKIEWKDVSIVPNLSLNSDDLRKVELSTTLHKIVNFDDTHETFIRDTICDLGFSVYVNRSKQYLNWRYRDCPINEYDCLEIIEDNILVGIVITKIFKFSEASNPEIDIVEIICSSDLKIIQELLNHVSNFYSNKAFRDANFNLWISLFDPRHLLMERLGFIPGLQLTYMCTKEFSKGLDKVSDYKNWYISMGDSDIY